MKIIDAYAEAMGIPTLEQMVSGELRRRKENQFRPNVPVNEKAVIERNRIKWEKKAKKNLK
jgi:hypothetical protein